MTANQWTRSAEDYIGRSREEFLRKSRGFQRAVSAKILNKWLPELSAIEGNIANNNSNLRAVNRLERIAREVSELEGAELATWYVQRLQRLGTFTAGYYSTLNIVEPIRLQRAYQRAASSLLFRIGYDGEKFVRGGFLYDLTQANEPLRRIKAGAFRAIGNEQSFRDFMRSRKLFINGRTDVRQGLYENYFRTAAYDSFQQFDRQINVNLADELGLDWAEYSGTTVERTREFCDAKVGKAFHRSEIEAWSNQNWAGKNEPYDPFIDLGGYNCMHVLRWITAERAAELGRTEALTETLQ